MLIIKVTLVGASLLMFFYFFIAARGRPVQKLAMSLVFVAIIFFSLFPHVSDRVAAVVGVDRGADLMLYLSTLALLFLCFNLYLNQKRIEDRLVVLVREIGLLSVRRGGPPPPTTDAPAHGHDKEPRPAAPDASLPIDAPPDPALAHEKRER